ncbi:hypothetical protein [Azospirillum thermophilum]|uniref:Phage holin family protein n=1 Tax=Azospirillum thermophilum TaxID=2202148 RepID=A0A2S2CSB7_9PROT|nr:hypothetical protein [Azospirillum thermophilum]AWK87270.1 hypothetical protein DEW08_14510 [Azospirillum thermophilum]
MIPSPAVFDRLTRNLHVLWRADRLIADIHLRHLIARSGLAALAGLVAAFGLVMLGVAAYLALERIWGPIGAAAAVGAAAMLLALLLLLVAARMGPGRELEVALEVHRAALDAVAAEARTAGAEVAGIGNALRHPLDAALPGLIVPLATVLLRMLRKPPPAT